jgi:signal transduction histidine kinase
LRLNRSIAAQLALGNGALLAALILITSGVFYFGTVGVLDRSVDGKIVSISNRLVETYRNRPVAALAHEIEQELTDGIDSDTEIFLVTSPSGQPVVGNLSRWPGAGTPLGQLVDRDVIRDSRPSSARLYVRALPQGGLLYIGRDLSEQRSIRELVLHALETAAALSLLLVVAGAWLLHYQLEQRIGAIRRAASEIEGGNLQRRIVISGGDEFARLGVDINRMLDRIEQLMSGVRDVSNAIAHDLRTPLSRVRAGLDEALRRHRAVQSPETARGASDDLPGAARAAIDGIDDLIVVFNKLLQIAEAESGMRTQSFAPVDLTLIGRDMVELYDAAAEEAGVRLKALGQQPVWTDGDHDLIASAVASMIDNAIKYAGPGADVEVSAYSVPQGVCITVRDNGPGVPAAELPRLTERFYRMDRSRNQPGNGLGLAIVSATAALHGGHLQLLDAAPGLRASMWLPPSASVPPARPPGQRGELQPAGNVGSGAVLA